MLLWPDSESGNARVALRSCISDLNQVLGSGWSESNGELIRLSSQFPLTLDALELRADLVGRRFATDILAVAEREFLDGVEQGLSDEMREWIEAQRASLKQEVIACLENKLQPFVDTHRTSEEGDASVATTLKKLDPYNELAIMCLMRIYHLKGLNQKAIEEYKGYSQLIESELGVRPSPNVEQYKASILSEGMRGTRQAYTSIPPLEEVEFVENNGVYIATKYFRSTQPSNKTIIFVWGFVSHLDRLLEEPNLRSFLESIALRANLIIFDKRGVGLSDRIGQPPSLSDTCSDISSIINHYGCDKVIIAGLSEGGPAAIYTANKLAQKVEGLVLIGTAAKWIKDEDYPYTLSGDNYDKWLSILQKEWGTALNLKDFAPGAEQYTELALWWARTVRTASSPSMIKRILLAAKHMDVRPLLPELHLPCLIVHARGDQMLRVDNGRYLKRNIKQSAYVELDSDKHWPWLDDTTGFFRGLDSYLEILN
ncbi:3-oxoadipate enol-lactonase [Saliniradius amylolyticus]|uniref:3-oxoadipate enol-lactonase n=1 Tax=Saliniradius amylolyticus TaxID=2183582 RepID=A0A2S2E5R1_9ALTE|nr:alpha/beta hydrolase [Saliniradius amylolyticus]AWL12994.1 3-oxoadipate enol-lactonase [Saliniradius amylolyticus]